MLKKLLEAARMQAYLNQVAAAHSSPQMVQAQPAPTVSTYTGGQAARPAPTQQQQQQQQKQQQQQQQQQLLAAQKKAEAEAKARAEAQNKAARESLLRQAGALGSQERSLRDALGAQGFEAATNQLLANIDRAQREQDQVLLGNFEEHLGGLRRIGQDNEMAEADASFHNLRNRGRERQDAQQSALAQGAGESDMLKAQLMALRNWDANQRDINRSYFDTLSSLNANIGDLNVSTRTARANLAGRANQDREQAWTNLFNQRSETYTQLGNLLNQRANIFNQAGQFSTDPHSGVYQASNNSDLAQMKAAEKAAADAYAAAAREAGRTWTNPGLGELANWAGAEELTGWLNTALAQNLNQDEETKRKKPEGAALRAWK